MFNKYLLFLLFLSGAAALTYEVAWTRGLSLFIGSDMLSTSAVIASFMAGLGLGAIVFKSATRFETRAILLIFAGMELAIGGFGYVSAQIVLNPSLVIGDFNIIGTADPSIRYLSKFLMSFTFLLVPTFLMGGTFPLAAEILDRSKQASDNKIVTLYAANTLGATAGALFAGFFLIGSIGISGTIKAAATLNFVIGIGLATLWWKAKALRQSSQCKKKLTSAVFGSPTIPREPLLICFFFAGLLAMTGQTTWIKTYFLLMGSSVQAISLSLAIFLFGIGVGSYAYALVRQRYTEAQKAAAAVTSCILIAFFISTNFLAYSWIPEVLVSLLNDGIVASYIGLLIVLMLISIILTFFPTIFMGILYSIILERLTDSEAEHGSRAADAYAFNTLGCIIGASFGPLVLIPWIGIEWSIISIIVGYLFLSVTLARVTLATQGWWRLSAIGTASVLLLLFILPSWNPLLMQSGAYIYSGTMKESESDSWSDFISDKKLLFYKEGRDATVSVIDSEQLYLKINGKTDATSSGDLRTQLAMSHLPALLHNAPRSALIVGLGSGISAGALSRYEEISSIKVIEISAAVIEASSFFHEHNYNVSEDPRITIVNDDVRNYLRADGSKYDLIISQPSNPWQSGSSKLFTLDYFELLASKLNGKRGIAASWINAYSFSPENLASVIATFGEVFKHVTVWRPMSGDILLLGSESPLTFNLAALEARTRDSDVASNLAKANLEDVRNILDMLIAPLDAMPKIRDFHQLNTDDLPVIEYSAYKRLYSSTVGANMNFLMSNLTQKGFEVPFKGLLNSDAAGFEIIPLGLHVKQSVFDETPSAKWLVSRGFSSGTTSGETIAVRNQIYTRWKTGNAKYEILSTLPGETAIENKNLQSKLISDLLSIFPGADLKFLSRNHNSVFNLHVAYDSDQSSRIKAGAVWSCPYHGLPINKNRQVNFSSRHLFLWQGILEPGETESERLDKLLDRFSCTNKLKVHNEVD